MLVELAVVVPVLIVLVLMSFQLGMMLRQDMTVSAAARAGARVGSSAGVDREADYEVLQAVAAGLGTIPVADIELVVVFKSDGGGQVPAACLAASQSGVCNRYTAADLTRPVSDFGDTTSCAASSPDRFWCPVDRERDQASLTGPDWFGVYVQVRNHSVAPTFLGDRSLSDTVVMRLEPRFQL